jgi:hypothetical protein
MATGVALASGLAALAPPAPAAPGGQVFHKGERVLIAPYAGEWEYCTLVSDRLGNPPANFSYSAICDRWSGGPGGHWIKETHLFSAERVHALDDPEALAGEAKLKAGYPYDHYGSDPQATAAPAGAPRATPARPRPAPPPPAAPPRRAAPAPGAQAAAGGNFKSPSQCTPGRRVTNNMGQTGSVVRVSQGSLCIVHLDHGGDSDGNQASLFWMLRQAGTSPETTDKLVRGTYECFTGNPVHYADMDVLITGPGSYRSANQNGAFHMGPANQIIYDSGALRGYKSKLLAGPSIGLNSNGDSFFGTHCDLKK